MSLKIGKKKLAFFNIDVLCALVPTILFVAHFLVTLLGNLGFFESVLVFYLLLIGIPSPASLAMELLLRMKMLLIGIVGFFVYMAYKQKTRPV